MSFKQLKHKLEKQATKFCLTSFKLNCASKTSQSANNKDYEFAPYEHSQSDNSQNKSIQLETQIALNREKLANLNTLKRQTTQLILFKNNIEFEVPDFQSTVIQNNTHSFTIHEAHNSSQFSNSSEFFRDEDSTLQQPHTSFKSCDSTASTFSDSDFESVNTFGFGPIEESLFICHTSYSAEYNDDLTLRRSDRVHVLMIKEAFALVQNIMTEDCGFVPIHCLVGINEFIKSS